MRFLVQINHDNFVDWDWRAGAEGIIVTPLGQLEAKLAECAVKKKSTKERYGSANQPAFFESQQFS